MGSLKNSQMGAIRVSLSTVGPDSLPVPRRAARCYLKNDAGPQSWRTRRWCSNRNQYMRLVSRLFCKIVIIMLLNARGKKHCELHQLCFCYGQFLSVKRAPSISSLSFQLKTANKSTRGWGTRMKKVKQSQANRRKKILHSQLLVEYLLWRLW